MRYIADVFIVDTARPLDSETDGGTLGMTVDRTGREPPQYGTCFVIIKPVEIF